jgi:hypothetical protein
MDRGLGLALVAHRSRNRGDSDLTIATVERRAGLAAMRVTV